MDTNQPIYANLARAIFSNADESPPVSDDVKAKIAEIIFSEYSNLFAQWVNDGNLDAIPYFQLVNAATVEGGKIFKCVDNRESHPIFQIAARANDEALKAAFKAIILEQAQQTTASRTAYQDSLDAGLDHDGRGFHGSRSPIDYGAAIKKVNGRKRSGHGDHYYGKLLHDAPEGSAEKELWRFWQALVLKDESNIPAYDFLRQLRLLSGKKIQETGIALGYADNTGSSYSKYENDKVRLPADIAHKIIDENLFDLPVDGKTGKVQSNVRTQFLQKFGIYEGTAEQLAAGIKSLAITHARHIAHGGAPTESPILAISAKNSEDENGYYRSQLLAELMQHRTDINKLPSGPYRLISVSEVRQNRPDLALPANADYLNLLPHNAKGDDYLLRSNPDLSAALAKSLVFEVAEHAPTLSSFLARYQAVHGRVMRAIGDSLGKTESRTSQILSDPESLSANNTKTGKTSQPRIDFINDIITTNAVELPTGADGKILPELVEAIWKLHRKEKYTSPYLNMVEAAEQALIPLPHDPTTWVARTAENATTEFGAWQEYWRKLSAQFERDGEVKINGEPVRCFKNADGHMLIHKNDIIRLEESKDFATLLTREDRKAQR